MKIVNMLQTDKMGFTRKQHAKQMPQMMPKQKRNGKKLLAIGAAVLAAAGVAGIAIYKCKGNKAVENVVELSEGADTLLTDLKFNKGIATKGDELFTGTAEYVNKKGDKFLLEYRYGKIVKSMKNINLETGVGDVEKRNFIKTYRRDGDTLFISKKVDKINRVEKSTCELSENKIVMTNAEGETAYTKFNYGKPKEQVLFDGTKRRWYENGQIEAEKLPDGTERNWYENGQIGEEKLPDGTVKYWNENGSLF